MSSPSLTPCCNNRAADQHAPDTASRHIPCDGRREMALNNRGQLDPSALLRIANMHMPRSINLTRPIL
jgi:hypothetical protein